MRAEEQQQRGRQQKRQVCEKVEVAEGRWPSWASCRWEAPAKYEEPHGGRLGTMDSRLSCVLGGPFLVASEFHPLVKAKKGCQVPLKYSVQELGHPPRTC